MRPSLMFATAVPFRPAAGLREVIDKRD